MTDIKQKKQSFKDFFSLRDQEIKFSRNKNQVLNRNESKLFSDALHS